MKTSKNKSLLKIFLKRGRGLNEIPTPETECAEGVFQIQAHICGIKFSSNISINEVRVNEKKTNLNQRLKPLNH